MAASVKPNLLEKTFKVMGENPNGAMYVAVAIAAFKGLFRPLYTMTDKKTDPQTKKYTAWREFLTEIIAIPVYIAVPLIGGKIVKKNLVKETAVVRKAAEANVKFIAVLASTAIIPAFCNLIQPPIMDSIKRKGEAKKALAENNKIATAQNIDKPAFKGLNPIPRRTCANNYGMRVGN